MNRLHHLLNDRRLYSPDEAGGEAAAPAADAPAPVDGAPAADAVTDPAAALDAPTLLGGAGDQAAGGEGEDGKDKPADEAGNEGKPGADGEAEGGEGKDKQDGEGDDAGTDLDLSGLTPPEGFKGLDMDALEAAKPDLAKLGLDAAGVQKVVDLAGKIMPGMMERAQAEGSRVVMEQVAEIRAAWAKDSLADAGIGNGNEKTMAENMALAARALDSFGNPALKQTLVDTGMGNHPEVIRLFVTLGKRMSEPGFAIPGAAVPAASNNPFERLAAEYAAGRDGT